MKNLFALLAAFLLAVTHGQAATLTLSNQNAASNGAYGVADSTGSLYTATGVVGIMGRMTLSDSAIAAAYATGNVAAINAGFEPFDPTSGTFTLNSLGDAGAFETAEDFDTRASVNSFGGSDIYVWIYKGASRTSASEHLIVKLNATFPTDSETEPPSGPQYLYLRPAGITSIVVGEQSATTHDYGRGSGALATFRSVPVITNNAPIATGGTASGDEDAVSITGTLDATDADSNPLTFAKVANPAHGSVTVTSVGGFTYVPAANYNGMDSFTFKANDGQDDSNIATITLTINSVPDAPVASAASRDVIAGRVSTGQLVAMDADGDALTYQVVAQPTKGTVLISSNGSYTYEPTAGQLGVDSFTFSASDGGLTSNTATITLNIVANNSPEANDASYSGSSNDLLSGTLTGSDADNDAITFSQGTAPTHGSLTVQSNGDFFYIPEAGFVGTDSFTFTVSDGYTTSATGTASLYIGLAIPEWIWQKGSSLTKQKGTYGIVGVASPTNTPGARSDAASATSAAGVSYVFGGTGFGETAGPGALSDLWSFNAITQNWTWLKGDSGINTPGIYGTKGGTAPTNKPGARAGGSMWVDHSGNVWLFGGVGRDSTLTGAGALNDLWVYTVGTQEWTWKAGANLAKDNGLYGSRGVPDTNNSPSARSGSVTWVDASNQLWLFGGKGLGKTGTTLGNLNDLWKFDTVTSKWTWVGGSDVIEALGNYGVKGTASPANQPGSRNAAVAWVGNNGLLYLFGGQGKATTASIGYLNDLWTFDPAGNMWTWLGGSNTTNALGVYGALGTEAATNVPGARAGAVAWLGADSSLLLSQGQGSVGHFNDVWRFNANSGQWTWIKGPSKTNGTAIYGTQGESSASNTPGARRGAVAMGAPSGDLWLFGGTNGANSNNDTWRLDMPATPSILLESISAITDISASVAVKAYDNDVAATGSLIFWPVGDESLTSTVDLGTIGSPTGSAHTGSLTGLVAGTRYVLFAQIDTDEGMSFSSRREFTTTGAGPATNAADFTLASSHFGEGGGSALIRVSLAQPASTLSTLTVTPTGTATSADYTAPAATLTFQAGQTFADITISITNDIVVDSAETIILTLSNPTGDIVLGSVVEHTLTIDDNDSAPQITSPPTSRFAGVGSSTTFSVTAIGTPPLTYQWKKDGVKIAGATKADYTIAKVALTSAGGYTVDVTGAIGPIATSVLAAELVVANVANSNVSKVAGDSITFNVTAAGNGLSYEWQKDGVPTGDTNSSLTLTGLDPAHSGVYRCRVYSGPAFGFSGTTTLAVTSAAPVISPAALASGFVGTPYSQQIVFTNLPAGAPTSVTVKGLPSGLKCSATGLITGIPTAATLVGGVVTAKTVTISAKNLSSIALDVDTTITISPVPTSFLGSYVTVIERNTSLASNLGGRLNVDVTSPGSFTAKLFNGSETYSSKAQLVISSQTEAAGSVSFVRKGLSPLVVAFTISVPALATDDTLLSGSLTDDGSPSHTAQLSGPRNPFSKTVPASKFIDAAGSKGYHTFGLSIPETSVGDREIPQGNGYGAFTVGSVGTLTCAGRTADGIAFTSATVISNAGLVPTFFPLVKTTPGSLLGTPALAVGVPAAGQNNYSGELSWCRAAALSTSKDQTYRNGFGPISLSVLGGNYVAPSASNVIMGLPNIDNKAKVAFYTDSSLNSVIASQVFSIRNLGTAVKQTVTVPPYNALTGANPNKVSFKFDTKVAGQFAGDLVIPNTNAKLVRTAKYQGMVVHHDGIFEAVGYYLLPELPEPGLTLTTSPVLSGQVVFGLAP